MNLVKSIVIDERDNVAVVIEDVKKGDTVLVDGEKVQAIDDIKTGHKIARQSISCGEMIIKYNAVIGQAIDNILKGQWVHCHNVKDITDELCRNYSKQYRQNGGVVK